jgi:hypothetical protein
MNGRLEVPVLDATTISVSLLRGDYTTAGSIMFLLDAGGLLEEWTHKKSVDDLAKNMSLHVDHVWQLTEDGQQAEVPLSQIRAGDRIIVHTGHVLPLDGILDQGDVMVNQASLTGESVPVAKHPGAAVYAGSVIEEGNCVVRVTHIAGENRYDRIVRMIEESERLKNKMVGGNAKVQEFLSAHESTPLKTAVSMADLLMRPELNYELLAEIDPERTDLPEDVTEQVEIELKYSGYIERQQRQVEQFKKTESRRIPEDLNYDDVPSLRIEARQKLKKIRPENIGQASRISGVSPADISVLLVYLKQN